jgi:hypothetical protein
MTADVISVQASHEAATPALQTISKAAERRQTGHSTPRTKLRHGSLNSLCLLVRFDRVMRVIVNASAPRHPNFA